MAEAATASPEAATVIVKGQRSVHPSRFAEAANRRNIWLITPEDGTPFENVLEPSYWAHVSRFLRPTDRIEVYAEDGSYFAELIVRSTAHLMARVALLRKVDLEAEEDDAGSGVTVKWRGPHGKYSVMKDGLKEPLQSGFETREQAMNWLAQNAKTIGVL